MSNLTWLIINVLILGASGLETCRFASSASPASMPTHNSDMALFLTVTRAPQRHNPWLQSLLRVTRHYNPTTKIYVILDREAVVEDAGLLEQLANLQVEVRLSAAYMSKNSDMARLRQSVPAQWAGQENYRFCTYAAVASDEGINRLMAIDADMALFSSVADIAAPYTEDIVSACYHTSQFIIINNITALHGLCDWISTYYAQDMATLQAYALLIGRTAAQWNTLHDMEWLNLYFLKTNSTKH
ncbi:hypothetical protein Agub_g12089, partial [Astrephomene gubernaculifera]